MLQRRSEVHRVGGDWGRSLGLVPSLKNLGLVFGTHCTWSSLLRESLRRWEAKVGVGPSGVSLPTRDTRVVHPVGKAGLGDPGDGGLRPFVYELRIPFLPL